MPERARRGKESAVPGPSPSKGGHGAARPRRTEGRPPVARPAGKPRQVKRLRIRPALEKDKGQVAGLIRRFCLEPGFNQKEFCIAEHRGQVVGCARLKFLGDVFELAAVAVKESYRGRGVGTLLVRQCLEQADEEVYCLTDKPEFFQRFGFREIDPAKLPSEVAAKRRAWCPTGTASMRHPGSSRTRTYRILLEKCQKDLDTTRRALEKVTIAVPPRSHYRKAAEDFMAMAKAYYSDAKHFYENGDIVNAFASVNYAHGWLDAGARLGLFDVGQDDKLFTLAE